MIANKNEFKPMAMLDDALEKIRKNAKAAETSADGLKKEFQWLREAGLLKIVLPGEALDFNLPHTPALLKLLTAMGKANLSVGRIFEGHINTLYLIHLYANDEQRKRWFAEVEDQGMLFGIWNTQAQPGITFTANGEQLIVNGCKTFCSGAVVVNRALITGNIEQGDRKGWQMAIVDMSAIAAEKIDKSSWKTLGMKASGSYMIDFSGYKMHPEDLISMPGIYLKQPHFSGGAIRFAAVHLGGAEAIAENTIQYLQSLNRTEDPIQKMRIATIMMQLTTGQIWLDKAGENYDAWISDQKFEQDLIAFANMTRVTIEDLCLRIMDESNKCIGARGLMEPYDMERIFRDLTFYLRQPAPDATRLNVADFFIRTSTSVS